MRKYFIFFVLGFLVQNLAVNASGRAKLDPLGKSEKPSKSSISKKYLPPKNSYLQPPSSSAPPPLLLAKPPITLDPCSGLGISLNPKEDIKIKINVAPNNIGLGIKKKF